MKESDFSKKYQIWDFWKKVRFLGQKTMLFKNGKGGNIAVERQSKDFEYQKFLPP